MSQTPSSCQSQRTTSAGGRSSLSVEPDASKVKVLETRAVDGVTVKNASGLVPGTVVVVVPPGIVVVVCDVIANFCTLFPLRR